MADTQKVWLAVLILFIASFTSHLSVAAEGQEESTHPEPQVTIPDQSRALGWMVFQVLIYTLLIIFLIIYFVRLLSKRQQNIGSSQLFQHLGGTPLGQNKSLQMIKVGGKIYLLGVGEQITLIKEIDDPEQIEEIERLKEMQQQILPSPAIGEWLTRLPFIAKKRNQSTFQLLLEESLQKQRQLRNQFEEELDRQAGGSNDARQDGQRKNEG